MNKKLTLNIDKNLISWIHKYSRETKQSISSLVEKYFKNLKGNNEAKTLNSNIMDLYGIFENNPLPDKKDMRKVFYEKNID